MSEPSDGPAARILAAGFAATECPRWHEGHLYFSDMHGKAVYRLFDDEVTKVVDVPGTPAGLGWLPDGSMLIVAQNDRVIYRLADGELSVHADLSSVVPSALNDMWVMPTGRAYVGEMGFDVHGFLAAAEQGRTDGPTFAHGRIFVIDVDGSYRPATPPQLMFPNGIVRGPRDDQLLVAESFGFRISVCDVAADGTLANLAVWAQLDFAPDGISLDSEGHLWVADPAGCRAALVAEGGRILRSVPTSQKCLSVALGGEDGHALYLCTTAETDPQRSVLLAGSHVEVASLAHT